MGLSVTHSPYWERISALAERARADREASTLVRGDPDTERAMAYLREGAGQAVLVYIEARTGDEQVRFSEVEFSLLERALNDWLDCYAHCYGVELDADFTVREMAELLIKTDNIHDTAQLLTGVPKRRPTVTKNY
ncbi:hypothetical protein ACFQH3_14805 [Haladaptatus sp. GCM10025707]|uniref:hypothetical protein n=1 Tax=Haladaptatus sp. GCM10025707 TaxID=3252658 RepID=UPI00361BCA88